MAIERAHEADARGRRNRADLTQVNRTRRGIQQHAPIVDDRRERQADPIEAVDCRLSSTGARDGKRNISEVAERPGMPL